MNNTRQTQYTQNSLDSETLNNFVRHASSLQDELRPFHVTLNKVNICCRIVNDICSALYRVLIIALPAWYFIQHVIFNDATTKILDFITDKNNNWHSLSVKTFN